MKCGKLTPQKGGNFINNFIFNEAPPQLHSSIYGKSGAQSMRFTTDDQGRMILSPSLNVAITANNLNIRNLTPARDTVAITASNLDIRDLSGPGDGVQLWGSNYIEASVTDAIPILGATAFLPRDTAPYSQNAYIVINNIGVAVTIQLQVAPVNIDSYYINDGDSFSLLGSQRLVLVPSLPMRFTRVRGSALLSLGNVTVHYMGRA